MSELLLPRRKFLLGAAGLIAAPAVIRVAKLMAVRSIRNYYPLFVSVYEGPDWTAQYYGNDRQKVLRSRQLGKTKLMAAFDEYEFRKKFNYWEGVEA